MIKYYRVLRDHPVWEKGAIISNNGHNKEYSAISDVWVKIPSKDHDDYCEYGEYVINNTDWYFPVFKVRIGDSDAYLSHERALKVEREQDRMHQENAIVIYKLGGKDA